MSPAKITKAGAMTLAAENDVAVYKSDSVNTIIDRINTTLRLRRVEAQCEAERLARGPFLHLTRFAQRQTYGSPRATQCSFPFGPRDWSGVRGVVLQ